MSKSSRAGATEAVAQLAALANGAAAHALNCDDISHAMRGRPSAAVPPAALANMCPGAGEGIFRVARAAGWIAHAIQIYAQSPRTDLPSLLNSEREAGHPPSRRPESREAGVRAPSRDSWL